MRLFFLLLILAGFAVAHGYPWALRNWGAHELGSWRVFDGSGGFRPVVTPIDPGDAPIRIYLYLTTRTEARLGAMTLTASTASGTVLAVPVFFARWEPVREGVPEGYLIHRDLAGILPEIEERDYVFTVAPGEMDSAEITAVDILLQSAGPRPEPWIVASAYGLAFLAAVGFFVTDRIRRRRMSVADAARRPRWGRG